MVCGKRNSIEMENELKENESTIIYSKKFFHREDLVIFPFPQWSPWCCSSHGKPQGFLPEHIESSREGFEILSNFLRFFRVIKEGMMKPMLTDSFPS